MLLRLGGALLVLVLVLLAGAAAGAAAGECRRAGAGLNASVHQNASGHWQAEVWLQQSGPVGAAAGPVKLIVRSDSGLCADGRTHSLYVSMQGPPPPPGPEYVLEPGLGWYKLHRTGATWPQAKATCEREGAHLLLLSSDAEVAYIQRLIQSLPQAPWFLVGFHDQDQEGQFVTIFGESLAAAGFPKWSQGQPDNAGGAENCGSISRSADINDIPCDYKAAFICEQELL